MIESTDLRLTGRRHRAQTTETNAPCLLRHRRDSFTSPTAPRPRGTIHEAGIPGSTSIWADPLHEGPVPGQLTDEELLDVRARYLASGADSDGDPAETIAELRRWREVIDDHESYDELVLWYEHDLFDQLNLIQLLSRIGRAHPVPGPVSLVCVGSFPGHPRFKGLGELTPGELGSLFATRQPVERRAVRPGRARMGGVPRLRSPAACGAARHRHVGPAVSGRRARASSARTIRGRATACREPNAG